MNKTIGNLLDEVSEQFADEGLTPVEIEICVEHDGGPWPVSMLDIDLRSNSLAFPYTTIDVEDADDVLTMHDLYKQMKNISGIRENMEIAAYNDSGDNEDKTEDGVSVFRPVKSFKFEDGEDGVRAAKVVLVC